MYNNLMISINIINFRCMMILIISINIINFRCMMILMISINIINLNVEGYNERKN